MQILGIIPARYASTRFPGKPLCRIGNKSMIERVYANVGQAKSISAVWVATDDLRIYNHVKQFGGNVVMTNEHPSGTDRCAEAVQKIGMEADVIINIQGDEPFLQAAQIDELARLFTDKSVVIGTLVKKITHNADLTNPNIPKVVVDKMGKALYFSRYAIPYLRDHATSPDCMAHTFYRHIGLYGYRLETLQQIVALPASALEIAEKLEQLRWLENGFAIHIAETKHESIAIDTPEDLERALVYYAQQIKM